MNIRLKRYKKDFEYSYTFGVFPTIELLNQQPKQVAQVLFHTKGESNQGVKKLHTLCNELGIPTDVNDKAIDRLAPRENAYSVGVFYKYNPELDSARNHVVLVNPSSMGNLGTVLRTMVGFGFYDLGIIQPAADIFDPRVIRASMGAIFRSRFETFDSFGTYLQSYPRNVYTLMTDGKTLLPEARFQKPYCLVFGNESSGLDDSFRGFGTSISIPQSDAIDSLNLAISVGVTLYQAKQAHEG
jgi:TrmH family RNA methyltransferase